MPARRPALSRLLLVACCWVVATAMASGLAWVAVSRLGHDSFDSSARTLTQSDVQRELGQLTTGTPDPATATDGSATTAPPARPGTRPRTGRPSVTTRTPESPGSTTSPPSSPITSSTPTTEDPPGVATTTPDPSPDDNPPPQPGGPAQAQQTRTWQLEGGNVGVTCDGEQITLRYAAPQDGWTLTIQNNGPREVEVSFTHDDDLSRLTASCANGRPVGKAYEGHSTGSEDQDS